MDFPAELEPQIEAIAQTEFNEPTNSLGFKLRDVVWDATGKYMTPELTNNLNNWQDDGELVLSWRGFINWVWRVIKYWWDELWN